MHPLQRYNASWHKYRINTPHKPGAWMLQTRSVYAFDTCLFDSRFVLQRTRANHGSTHNHPILPGRLRPKPRKGGVLCGHKLGLRGFNQRWLSGGWYWGLRRLPEVTCVEFRQPTPAYPVRDHKHRQGMFWSY